MGQLIALVPASAADDDISFLVEEMQAAFERALDGLEYVVEGTWHPALSFLQDRWLLHARSINPGRMRVSQNRPIAPMVLES